jgi:hypothetical protein
VYIQQVLGATKVLLLNTTLAPLLQQYCHGIIQRPQALFLQLELLTLTNAAHTYIAYCFNSVEGYSKFGSYTGNGSADGPFVYTGFRPAFVMVKRTDSHRYLACFMTHPDSLQRKNATFICQPL